MSLKEKFYSKAVDRFLCPAAVIDSLGHTPYINSKIFNRVVKPHIAYPLIALSAQYALTQEWKQMAIGMAAGHGLTAFYTLIGRAEAGAKGKEFFMYDRPQFHTDRTQKQQSLLSPALEATLGRKKELSQGAFKQAVTFSAIAMGFTDDIQKSIGFASVYMLDYGSRFWQNKRAVEGEWNVTEAPPKPKPKERDLPLPALT